jgi:hypothetical protein
VFDIKKIHVIPFIAVFLSFSIASLVAASSRYGKDMPGPGQHLNLQNPKKPRVETIERPAQPEEDFSSPPAVGMVKPAPEPKPSIKEKEPEKRELY